MDEEKENQLTKITIGLLMVVALFYDLVQFAVNYIPVIGQVASALVAIFAFCHFFLWFKMHGVSFTGIKKTLTMGGGFLIEVIPVLNMLPGWMVAVAGTIILSRVPVAQAIVQAASGDVTGVVSATKAGRGAAQVAHIGPQAINADKSSARMPKREKRPVSINESKRSYQKKDTGGGFRDGLRDTITQSKSYAKERQLSHRESYLKKAPFNPDEHRLKYRGTLIDNTDKTKAA